ncbi:MAG: HK97 family phage prohead protease [Thalassobaculum sp.]|uniref:HK97 family phage prohead protease n=1 Tax=Thalassobaculum sp. TaxID=2022740 RepID=UPI0032EDDE08
MGAAHTAPFCYMKKFLNLTNKSLAEFSASTYQELWRKAAAEGYEALSVCVHSTFTKAEGSDKFHAIFSSANEDRHGDIVHQDFDLKGFKKNPVFLDSHNYGSIERIIGRIQPISVKDGKLQGDIHFAMANPLGALAAKLAEDGFLNTTSIGFIPREFNDKGEILKSELLEVSAVSVPANADAQFEKTVEPEATPAEENVAPICAECGELADAPAEAQSESYPICNACLAKGWEPATAPVRLNRTAVAARVVSQMAEEQKQHLRTIARAVQELNSENQHEQKRKVHQVIRKMLAETAPEAR